MKLSLIFAVSMMGTVAANAAVPSPVAGTWKALPLIGVTSIPMLKFTPDGRLYALFPSGLANSDQLLGQYDARDTMITARSRSGETYAYELMKDGRLCVFPGPGMVTVDGTPKTQSEGRQCYQRM